MKTCLNNINLQNVFLLKHDLFVTAAMSLQTVTYEILTTAKCGHGYVWTCLCLHLLFIFKVLSAWRFGIYQGIIPLFFYMLLILHRLY